MNSSERATSSVRQSASLVGIEEVSRAFFRRWVSLWTRAEIRDFISLTIFSSSSVDCALSLRLLEFSRAVISCSTTLATMDRTAEVPRISLVCPSNWGSARRTVSTAVRPARMSSFSILSLPALSLRALDSTALRKVFTRACSKPAWWVPPLGVEMMFTKLRIVVS